MGNRVERNNEPRQSLLAQQVAPTEAVDVNLLVDQPNIKKICAVKNPVFIKKDTIVLERSAEDRNLFYIQFKYDALVDFDLYINFLVKKDVDKDKENSNKQGIIRTYTPTYLPSRKASELSLTFHNLPRGQNVSFLDKHALFDLRKFTECKDEIEDSYDVALEIVPTSGGHPLLFVTLCRITSEDGGLNIKIKTELQRLKVQGIWIDMYEVFNCALDAGECLICCTSERSTIFLPCKHSCTCSNCAHSLRMRNNPCPICKKAIDDLLIIEIEEGRNK